MSHVIKSKTLLAAVLSLLWAASAMAHGNCTHLDDPLTNMTFQLDWKFNAQFAGVFMADHEGYFKAAGVAMTIKPWEDGVNVVLDVAEGRADFACVEQNLIIAAQAEGLPVKAVATMFQASPYGLMAPPLVNGTGVDLSSLEVLFGQNVGVHIDGLKVMALVKGVNGITDDQINVTEIPYDGKWLLVESGEVAAVQCYTIDEPIGVEATYGVEPQVLKLSAFGLLSTAQTIVVSEETLANHGDHVMAVLAAIFQGWEDALADKAGTAEIVVDKYVEEGSVYKDVAYQTRTLELLESYVLVESGPIGVIDPTVWNDAATLMLEYGIVSALPNLNSTLATEYYEGPGVLSYCDEDDDHENEVGTTADPPPTAAPSSATVRSPRRAWFWRALVLLATYGIGLVMAVIF